MAFFIKSSTGDIFEMDATVEVGYNQTGKPTEYAIASKRRSSDHYDQMPDTVRFSGLVSKVKFARRREADLEVVETLEEFEGGLQSLKRSGEFFSCSFSDNLPILKNCLFTSLRMSRNSQGGLYQISVDFSIQQIIVSNQAELVASPIPASAYADVVEESEKGGSSTTEATAKEESQLKQALRDTNPDLAESIYGPVEEV